MKKLLSRLSFKEHLDIKVTGLILIALIISLTILGAILTRSVTTQMNGFQPTMVKFIQKNNLKTAEIIRLRLDSYFQKIQNSYDTQYDLFYTNYEDFALGGDTALTYSAQRTTSHMSEEFPYFKVSYVGTSKGQFYINPEVDLPETYDPRDESWYKEAISNNKDKTKEDSVLVWSDVYLESETNIPMVKVSRPVYSTDDEEILGVMATNVVLDKLSEVLIKEKEKMDYDNMSLFIVDNNSNKIIAHSNQKLISKNINEYFEMEKTISNSSNNQNTIKYTSDDEKHIASYERLDTINSTIFISAPSNIIEAPIKTRINNAVKAVRNSTLGIGALSIIIIIILIYYIVKLSVTRPLFKLVEQSRKVARGNLNIEVDIDKEDEIGILGNAFNDMVLNLKEVLSNVDRLFKNLEDRIQVLTSNSQQIGAVSEQVSNSIQQVAIGANEQATDTDDINNKMGQLVDKLDKLNENNDNIGQLINTTQTASQTGRGEINKVQNQMKEIKGSMNNVDDGINELNAISEEIGTIVEMINNISNQTNLLALNAAIEAARAGQAGEGFAVVADEIRGLAEESSYSAEKIKSLIEEVKDVIDKANGKMKDSKVELNKGEEVTKVAKEAFNDINDHVLQVVEGIKMANQVIEEANHDSKNVAKGMEGIASIAQQTSANAEEVSAASQEQNASVENVLDVINRIEKLSDDVKKVINKFEF